MKKVNPLTKFREGDEVRKKKILNSYPKYAMGGPGDGDTDDILKKRAGYVIDELKLYDQANKRKAMKILRERRKTTKKGKLFGTSYAPGRFGKEYAVDKDLFKYLKGEIKSKY